MVRMHQIAFGAIGVVVMFAGGWLFWYYAIRPRHPSPYSLFEIVLVPLALLATGILCLLAAVGAFTDARLKLWTWQAARGARRWPESWASEPLAAFRRDPSVRVEGRAQTPKGWSASSRFDEIVDAQIRVTDTPPVGGWIGLFPRTPVVYILPRLVGMIDDLIRDADWVAQDNPGGLAMAHSAKGSRAAVRSRRGASWLSGWPTRSRPRMAAFGVVPRRASLAVPTTCQNLPAHP